MYGIILDTAVTNVLTTYTLIASDLPAHSRIQLISCLDNDVAFTVGDYSSTPATSITAQSFVTAGGTNSLDSLLISNKSKLYLRSLSGADITTGVIYITMWGRR